MTIVNSLIDGLEKTPDLLEHLIKQIPEFRLKQHRVSGKWSIHDQVCHLVDAQHILLHRFKQFEVEDHPVIKSYNPDIENPASGHPVLEQAGSDYEKRDLNEQLAKFREMRSSMVRQLRSYEENFWQKEATHEGFDPYNARLLLTHCLHVDFAHMFSIEQLGLTRDEFAHEIMTLP